MVWTGWPSIFPKHPIRQVVSRCSIHFFLLQIILVENSQFGKELNQLCPQTAAMTFALPGRFEPPVTVIMLSPGVTGASLLSVSIGSQHIVWLVYTVRWEQWISSAVGSIRSDTVFILIQCTVYITRKNRENGNKNTCENLCWIIMGETWATPRLDPSRISSHTAGSRGLKQRKQLRVTWSERKKKAESHVVWKTENSWESRGLKERK